jgi:uncharacterized protein (DUF885 family)
MPVVNPRNVLGADLAALLAHEGMPGHHLEGGIKVENNVPEFRRSMWVNAFGEGWALYAESLGFELGLYDEPLELIGRTSCQGLPPGGRHRPPPQRLGPRAASDTSLRMRSNRDFATNEVLRYGLAGRALGYKLGGTILELRAKAAKRLGPR